MKSGVAVDLLALLAPVAVLRAQTALSQLASGRMTYGKHHARAV